MVKELIFMRRKIYFFSGSQVNFLLHFLDKAIREVIEITFFGMYCLISLLVFSIHPFYQEDWSRTIAEIDKQLFSKYGLTKEEITFIEKMIKQK